MSSEIDQRIVEMKFENGQFENGVKNSISTLEKLKSALKFDTRADGFENIQKSADSLNFSKVEEALDSVINRYSTLGIIGARVIENLVDKAMTGIDTVIGKIQSGGMSRALNLEQAKFQLKGLDVPWDESLKTGIAKNVNDAVTDTAFGLDAAAKAASQLVASNVEVGESMDHALKAISGVAAMTNSTYDEIAHVFTRIAGNGKVMSQDLMSFSARGLNAAAALGKVLDYTEAEIRQMVNDSEINFEIFSEAMYKAFAEHAKKANETFSGAMSNVSAGLSRIGERFATPYIQNMRPVLVELIGFLKAINKSIDPLVNSVSGVMSKISTTVVDGLHAITGQLVDINDESRPLLTGASNWMLKIATALKEIIDGLGGMVSMFTDFWSTAFNVPDSNPLVDFANGLYEAASVFKYAFTGIANEDSAAVKEFIAIFGDSSGIFEDFKAAVTSVANVINILYSKLRLIWQKIVQPLAMRILPAILKYIRSMAEEIETIVKLLLDNKIVDTAISGIGKGLTTVADLIFSIGGKAEDSAKQVQKAAEDTATAVSDSAKTINKRVEEIFSSRESIIAKFYESIREAASGAWGSEEGDVEAVARRLGLTWDEIDKFKELVEEYKKVGESLFDGIDFNDGERLSVVASERIASRFDDIYSKNAQLIDSLKQEAIESVQSTFKHVTFDERSVDYMGDTFFNRLYDKLMENGFGEKDALAIVHKFREDFVTEYEAQSEEDMKAWQDAIKEEATKHEELRAEFARDYSKDRESMMGWTSSSVYSDMEKANKAFDKAWDRINSKNKGKSFDQLDYSQMFNDFYEESYKALIDMGMSEDEAIRRSLINKQTYINKWAEMDEETFLLMEANAEEYVKTLDEMTPIEKIAFTIRNIFDTITSVGQKAYNNVIKPIGEFIGGLGKKAWGSISTSAQNIWGWVTKTWGLFKNSKAFQDVSKTFKDMKTNAENLWGSLSKVLEPLLDLIPEIKIPEFDPEIAERFAKALGNIATAVSKGLSGAVQKLVDFKEAVKKHLVFDKETGQLDIVGTLQKNFEDAKSFIVQKATEFGGYIKSFFVTDDGEFDILKPLKDGAGAAVQFVSDKLQWLRERFDEFVVTGADGKIDYFATFQQLGESAIGAVRQALDGLIEDITSFPGKVIEGIDNVIGKLFGFDNADKGLNTLKKDLDEFVSVTDSKGPLAKGSASAATRIGVIMNGAFAEFLETEANSAEYFTGLEDGIERLGGLFSGAFEAIQGFIDKIIGLPGYIKSVADELGVSSAISTAITTISNTFGNAKSNVEGFLSFIQGLPSAFGKTFGNNLNPDKIIGRVPAKETIEEQSLIEKFLSIVAEKAGEAQEALAGFGDAIKGLFTENEDGELGIVVAIRNGFNELIEFIVGIPKLIQDAINGIFGNDLNPEKIMGRVPAQAAKETTALEDFFANVGQKASEAKGAVEEFASYITGLFEYDENGELGLFKEFSKLLETIKAIPSAIGEAISSITLFSNKNDPEVLKGWVAPDEYTLGGFLADIYEKVKGVSDTIAGWFTNLKESVSDVPFVKDVLNKIETSKTTISQWFDELNAGDISIFETILTTVNNIKTAIQEWFKDFKAGNISLPTFDDIKSDVESIGSTISEWFSTLMQDVGEIPFIKAMIEGFKTAKETFDGLIRNLFGENSEGETSEVANAAMYSHGSFQTGSGTMTRKSLTTPENLKGWVGEFGAKKLDPTFVDQLSSAFEFLGGVLGNLVGTLTSIVSYLSVKIPEAINTALPVLISIGEALAKLFEPVGKTIGDIFSNVYEAIKGFTESEEAAADAGKKGKGAKESADQVNESIDIMGTIIEHIASFIEKVKKFLPTDLDAVKDLAWTYALVSLFSGLGEFFSGLGKLASGSWGSGIIDKIFFTFQTLGSNVLQLGKGITYILAAVAVLANIKDTERVDKVLGQVINLVTTILGAVIMFRLLAPLGQGVGILKGFDFAGIFNNLGLMVLSLGAGIGLILGSIVVINALGDNADTVIDKGLTQIYKILSTINDGVMGLMVGEGAVNLFGGIIGKYFGIENFKVGLEHVAGVILALGLGVALLVHSIKSVSNISATTFTKGLDRVKEIITAIGFGVSGIFLGEGIKDFFTGLGSALAGEDISSGFMSIAAVFGGLAASIWVVSNAVTRLGKLSPEELEQGMDAASEIIDMIVKKVKSVFIALGGLDIVGGLFGGGGSGGDSDPVKKVKNVGTQIADVANTIRDALVMVPGPVKAVALALAGIAVETSTDIMHAENNAAELNKALSSADFEIDFDTFFDNNLGNLTKIFEAGGLQNADQYVGAWTGAYYNAMVEKGEYISPEEYWKENPIGILSDDANEKIQAALAEYDPTEKITGVYDISKVKGAETGEKAQEDAQNGFEDGLSQVLNTETETTETGEEAQPVIIKDVALSVPNDSTLMEEVEQKYGEVGLSLGSAGGSALTLKFKEGVEETLTSDGLDGIETLGTQADQSVASGIDASADLVKSSGENVGSQLTAGIESKRSESTEASRLTGEESWTQIDSYVPSWGVSGTNAALGFINAIRNRTQDAIDAAKIFASEPLAAMRTILNEHSPSRETGQIAIYAALGFINEINNSIPAVRSASEGMASSFLDGLSTASDLASQVLSDDFQLDPTIQPIIDSSQIQNGVNEINGLFGQRSLDLATNASVEFTNQQQQMYESMQYPDPINYNEKFDTLSGRLDALQQAIINSPITLDSGILVGALRPQMDSALGSMSMRRNRGL